VAESSPCPHCGVVFSDPHARPGDAVDCASCDRSFVLPRSGASEGPTPVAHEVPRSSIERDERTDRAEAPLGRTGVVAAALTVAFYLLVVRPLLDTPFGEIFGKRGWVQYVISFFSIWSGVLLAWKYRRLRSQSRVFELDLLPVAISERLTRKTTPAFLSFLRGLPSDLVGGFLVRRLCRTLEQFRVRADVPEAVDFLRAQAQRDEAVVESSFTMLRVFIWAIPILGFIGTVVGIGASVGGFSESVSAAADLEVMKDSIGSVTTGLGVAFDTTLLALVMSLFIMFPTSSLQKAEEDFLARVDEYCQRHLVARLDDDLATARRIGDEPEWVATVADRLADRLLAALERRSSGDR
jgi:hypothetical protein